MYNFRLQEQLSDTEDDKDKLQASRQHAERLEAEREEYQRKCADSNEWIMHHLCTQVYMCSIVMHFHVGQSRNKIIMHVSLMCGQSSVQNNRYRNKQLGDLIENCYIIIMYRSCYVPNASTEVASGVELVRQ